MCEGRRTLSGCARLCRLRLLLLVIAMPSLLSCEIGIELANAREIERGFESLSSKSMC